MKLYRVRYLTEGGNSGGYTWHTSRHSAEWAIQQACRQDPEEYEDLTLSDQIDEINIPKLNKAALMDLLITYAEHPDNG